jgi:dual specificity MAP kinase phosphatase
MATMTAASEIAPNVFLGPTPDSSNPASLNGIPLKSTFVEDYDVLVEASDVFPIPSSIDLEKRKATLLLPREERQIVPLEVPGSGTITEPRYNSVDVDGLLAVCKWIYEVSTGEELQKDDFEVEQQEMAKQFPGFDMESPTDSKDVSLEQSEKAPATPIDADGDTTMALADDEVAVHIVNEQAEPNSERRTPKKVLIHCPDGYTETSLVALTYTMYAHGITVGEAWTSLHTERRRNFFAYPADVTLLTTIQPRILASSPALLAKKKLQQQENADHVDDDPMNIRSAKSDPVWLTNTYDGSLPSRILPYLYLGNIAHAQTPALLKELGIKRIVTVGERIDWAQWNRMLSPNGDTTAGVTADWDSELPQINGFDSKPTVREETHHGFDFLMIGPGVLADNGVDGLMPEFDRCLNFIERSKLDGASTLVHCRVGVSRSATICIAHVMREMNLSFPRAYCFVRARRLNVIIQPHLRFVYELLKWEEELRRRRGLVAKREMEWAWVAREIAAMNRPYSSR